MVARRVAGSFRDPSGFMFVRDGVLLRQVQERYRPHYEHLMGSGLYAALVRERFLIPHEERPRRDAMTDGAAVVIRPERVPFISFPYEWTFAQRREAALLTLRIQELALEHGMSLKDASAYNIQFIGSRPILIDTLSLEIRAPDAPWIGYRQFCQHFLAPLALQSLIDVRTGLLLRQYIDGIPLDLASRMLPASTYLKPWAQLHIHLHARSIARHASTAGDSDRKAHTIRVTTHGLRGLLSSLTSTVAALRWHPPRTEWGSYEETLGYSIQDRETKRTLVAKFVASCRAQSVLDLGANAGEYSEVARAAGADNVVAIDGDPAAAERHFLRLHENGESGVLPLWIDLANPSPAQGWDHHERPSLAERGPFDVVLALALVHHLAIGNNVPLVDIATMLARLGRAVIVEWIPKSDAQVQRLLSGREDIFDSYDEHAFRDAFARCGLQVHESAPVGGSGRVLYHFRQ